VVLTATARPGAALYPFSPWERVATSYPLSRRERVGVRGASSDNARTVLVSDPERNPSPCPLPSGERVICWGFYAARFHAIMRTMSPGCLGSSRTTEASKPECIAQFLQSGSCRDSQYSQSVPFQNSSNVGDHVLPIR
jgi:hypothetical protein